MYDMKMKYMVIGYTVVIALLLCFIYTKLENEQEFKVDMVYYNRQLKDIELELDSINYLDIIDSAASKEEIALKISDVEKRYSCIITLVLDEDYEKCLNNFISEGYTVFDYGKDEKLVGKIAFPLSKNHYEKVSQDKNNMLITFCAVIIAFGYILLGVIYYIYLRPFRVLGKFSSEIAKGNLDFKLPMEKRNIFGAFTESFDIMREELKNAREREYQANISKKELVAELSHDIKTPLSTIKATCEVMQITEENDATKNKINVILNKADMIDQLVGNMFHATMEELRMLKVEAVPESSLSILDMFSDLKYYGNIFIDNDIPEYLVNIDKLRMKQVIDNIINNSYKYARTDIHVSFRNEKHKASFNEGMCIKIKDSGNGVPEDELALVAEKFYRGTNAKGQLGSGIGMYLAKNFMKQMDGEIEYYNDNGFVVELFIRKA